MAITKEVFLRRLQSGRAQWEAALSDAGEARMEIPGVVGEWTLKDVIAHVAWYEMQMTEMLQTRTLEASELWGLDHEMRNAAIYEANRDRPLDEVLAEAAKAYHDLEALVVALDDEDLNNPTCFADMPDEWEPWRIIASNSYGHYQEHIPDIRAWLYQQGE
jgi:hypothetical protein